MQYPLHKTLGIAFWLLALVEIIAVTTGTDLLHYIMKPLLMPVLILLLFYAPSASPGKKLLLAGLFFSWFGDILLMLETMNPLFFIFGLVCFLTTHIFYIIYFLRIKSADPSLLKKQPFFILLVLLYGAGLVWLLFPHLGELTLPVIVYAIVICSMLLCSLHVFLKLNRMAAGLYVAGAAAFVLSDSLLAINKFYQPFAFAGALIMLTYCAAQYFIVNGFSQQEK